MPNLQSRILLLPLLFLPTSSPAQSTIKGINWLPIGPAPINGGQTYGSGAVDVSGRATAIAVNPMNPDDVWLGTAAGGVWHSKDGGKSWGQDAQNELESSYPIGTLALSECTVSGCGTVYAGTGENAIRRDTLYGVGLMILETRGAVEFQTYQWQVKGGDKFGLASINNVVLDRTTAGAAQRIYITLSSGETASGSESTVTAPEPTLGYGIYKSEDRGETWTKVPVPGTAGARPTDLEMDPQNSNILFAGFLGKGIFKGTRNAGTRDITWCPLNPGITAAGCPAPSGVLPSASTSTFDHVEIAIHHPSGATPAVLYALFGNCPDPILGNCKPSIFQSTDSGATWSVRFTGTTSPSTFDSSCPRSYTRYTHGLTIDPSNPDVIVLGALRACRFTSSMLAFQDLGTDSVHPDHHAIVFPDASNTQRLYDSSDGGFAYSTNGGSTWNSGNRGLQITEYQSVASSRLTGRIIAGAQDNGTSLWTGTRNWRLIAFGDGGPTIMDGDSSEVIRLYGTDTRNVVSGLDGTPIRSTSGGTSAFSEISGFGANSINMSEPAAFYPAFTQAPSFPFALYFGTNRLYKSVDDGDNWLEASPVLGGTATVFSDIGRTNVITAIAVAPTNPNRIYIGYYDGQIWVTNNPCDSMSCWSLAGGPVRAPVTRIAVDPGNENTAYVTYSAGISLLGQSFSLSMHVYKTTNGGSFWTPMSGSGAGALPDVPVHTISIEPSAPLNLWVGTDRGVHKSTDGGATWSAFNSGLPNSPVYEISINEQYGRVYAATHGRGVYVITQPFLSNFEGWVDGGIWDIPVYGGGFLPNQSSCTLQIIQQNGNVCASGTVDAQGGTIGTDADGTLISGSATYGDRPVAWGCFNGQCVGNTPIAACNTGSPVTTVTVTCGAQVGIDKVLGCPQQTNPPTSVLGLSGLPSGAPVPPPPPGPTPAPPPSGFTFFIVPTVQSGDGSTRVLCSVPVTVQGGDTRQSVLARAQDNINTASSCVAAGVSASLLNTPAPGALPGEDFTEGDPRLAISASTLNGGQLIPSLVSPPGAAKGLCFDVDGLGVPVLNSLIISRVRFSTPATGAAGGGLTFVERSDLGTCAVPVATSPGSTGAQLAAAVSSAFRTPGSRPGCDARDNPRDVLQDGDSVTIVMASKLALCTQDSAIGFSIAPEELPIEKLIAPVVTIAGVHETIYKQERLTANAVDPTGSTLTYKWRATTKSAAIANGNSPTPDVQFDDYFGDYTFEVEVTNSSGQKGTASITIRYVGRL